MTTLTIIRKPPGRGGEVWRRRKETLRMSRRRRGRGKEKVRGKGWDQMKRTERGTRGRCIAVGHL